MCAFFWIASCHLPFQLYYCQSDGAIKVDVDVDVSVRTLKAITTKAKCSLRQFEFEESACFSFIQHINNHFFPFFRGWDVAHVCISVCCSCLCFYEYETSVMFLRVAVVTKTQGSHKHHGSCMLNEGKKEGRFKKTERARREGKR